MVFAISMIFALALITMTTVVMTVFAVLLMQRLLGLGQFSGQVHALADAFRADQAQSSRAIS
jgi:hypothetical protein